MGWFRDLRMTRKLIGGFAVVALLAVVVGGTGAIGMGAMQGQMVQVTQVSTPALVSLLDVKDGIDAEMRATRGEILATTAAKRADLDGDARNARARTQRAFAAYLALPCTNARERALARDMGTLLPRWQGYSERVAHLAAQRTAPSLDAARALSFGPEADTIDALTGDLTQLLDSNQRTLAAGDARAASAHDSALAILVAAVLAALALALALGVLIARSIVRPLAEVKAAATSVATICMVGLEQGLGALARGDLTVAAHVATTPPTYTSRDEIGQTAEVVRAIIGHAQASIGAYETARAELRGLVGQVARAATLVDSGAERLAAASAQIGQASAQVATAIEEVARGASAQSRTAADALGQMTELGAAVAQVSGGAAAPCAAIGQTERALGALRTALDHTTASVAAVTGAADHAAATAKDGGAAVAQTIESIAGVRTAVLASAAQVEELGKSSAEIGQIVAAIDDIASQTNLLALNAAIEAARAGEHGKGFTVVAAEVRKLAARASNETQEITGRIAAIQRQVAEVVAAMETGSGAVERSATLGRRAGQALEGILGVVEETNAQAVAIGGAVAQMTASVEAVDAAAGRIATVAGETVRATERMRAGAEGVGAAMESIAAVSEESAAGAEEVSASTQEQTASVQELGAGAQDLAAQASTLQAVVARFTLVLQRYLSSEPCVPTRKSPCAPLVLSSRTAPSPRPPMAILAK